MSSSFEDWPRERSESSRYASVESQIASLDLQTSQQNLTTAKLAHKKMVEQLSMRTATIAQMATTLMAAHIEGGVKTAFGAKEFVKIATEIMVEAETSAAKEKELQEAKDK